MQPATGVADALHELALDEGMDVFVRRGRRRIEEGGIAAGGKHVGQAAPDLVRVAGRQHAGALERRRPGNAAAHVVLEEAAIEPERAAELDEGSVGIALEPS